jgi:hypothetical protein
MEKKEPNVTHVTRIDAVKRMKGYLKKKKPRQRKPAPARFRKPKGTRKAIKKGYSKKIKEFFFADKRNTKVKKRQKAFLKEFSKIPGKGFCNIAFCCEVVGINRRTYYRWYASDETFRNAVEAAKQTAGDYVVSVLFSEAVGNKNTKCLIYFDQTHGTSALARKQQSKAAHDYSKEVTKFVESNNLLTNMNDTDDGIDNSTG